MAEVAERPVRALDSVLRLGGVLAAGEGEVGFGIVGADAAAQDHGEAEGEPAEQNERRGEEALAPRLAPEEERHRRRYPRQYAPADEERRDLFGEQRLARRSSDLSRPRRGPPR